VVGGVFVALFFYIILSTGVLYFTNSPSPLVLSVLAALFGILPVFAAWMVYAYPIYLHLMAGSYVSAAILVGFQLLWNTVFDFYFKARYRGTLHPAILIGSMIAGIAHFGFPGLLVGPLIVTIIKTIASVESYHMEPVDVVSEDLL
jgi:predicted PurR-regulated permease PerM